MNYARIKKFDIANGPGVRISLYVSGCTHRCKGCFNEVTWDFNYGQQWTKEVEDDLIEHLKKPEIKGLNVLGGEPLQQQKDLFDFLKRVCLEVKKPIWLWTGYNIVDIINKGTNLQRDILYLCDVVVDGLFIEEQKDITLKYRGSANQRVIDMKKTLDKKRTDIDMSCKFTNDMLIELEGC